MDPRLYKNYRDDTLTNYVSETKPDLVLFALSGTTYNDDAYYDML